MTAQDERQAEHGNDTERLYSLLTRVAEKLDALESTISHSAATLSAGFTELGGRSLQQGNRLNHIESHLAEINSQLHTDDLDRLVALPGRAGPTPPPPDTAELGGQLRVYAEALHALRNTQKEQGARTDSGFALLAIAVENITTLLNRVIEKAQ